MFVYPWQQTTRPSWSNSSGGVVALAALSAQRDPQWSCTSRPGAGETIRCSQDQREAPSVKRSLVQHQHQHQHQHHRAKTSVKPSLSVWSGCMLGKTRPRPDNNRKATQKDTWPPVANWTTPFNLECEFCLWSPFVFFKLCITACCNGLGFVIPNSIAQLFPSSFEGLMTWIFCFDLIITLCRSESTHHRSFDCCFTVFVKMTLPCSANHLDL